MKKNLVFGKLCIGMALLGFAACSDDDVEWPEVDGAAPQMELKTDHIRSELGYSITVKGDLADADGISTVQLQCPTLFLDKTIDLIGIYGEPQKTYSLDYTHPINNTVNGMSHDLIITVTDCGGRSVAQKILVTLDADFVAPMFTVVPNPELTVLIKDPTQLKLNIGIEDNKSLKYVKILLFEDDVQSYEEWLAENSPADPDEAETYDADKTDEELVADSDANLAAWEAYYSDYEPMEFVDMTNIEGNSFAYQKNIEIVDEEATYTLIIRAEDNMYHVINHKTTYNVQELPDFAEMYLADVETAKELNSDVFGVPVQIEHTGSYEYEARYYNAAAGTQICFLPQDTDFAPICFAPSKEDPNLLGDDLEEVNKFVLDKANTYYHFKFNTLTREYSMDTYSVSDAHDPVENMTPGANHLNLWQSWGSDFANATWEPWQLGIMTWANALHTQLDRDKSNKHIWRTEPFKLDAGSFNFYVGNYHRDGWWGYTEWRAENAKNPVKCIYIGRWFEDNSVFGGNEAYFLQKYGEKYPDINQTSWNANSSVYGTPGNWFNPTIPKTGNYIFEVDFHTENCRLVPAN